MGLFSRLFAGRRQGVAEPEDGAAEGPSPSNTASAAPEPNDESIDSPEPTAAPVDWSRPAEDVLWHIRSGSACAFAYGCRIDIPDARIVADVPRGQAPGTFAVGAEGIETWTGQGKVLLLGCRFSPTRAIGAHAVTPELLAEVGLPLQGQMTAAAHDSFQATAQWVRVQEILRLRETQFGGNYFLSCLVQNRRFVEQLMREFRLDRNSRTLDLACGMAWMAWLLSERGVESHACDLFPADTLPRALRDVVHYSQADAFDLPAPEKPYDLVFLRNLTNEYRASDFDADQWQPFFARLGELVGDRGVVYWVLIGSPKRLGQFDELAAAVFSHRRYRLAGKTAAILTNAPDRLPAPSDSSAATNLVKDTFDSEGFAERLLKTNPTQYIRWLYAISNKFFRFIEYRFDMPLAVCVEGPLGEGLDAVFNSMNSVQRVRPGQLDADQPCGILCRRDDLERLRGEYPEGWVMGITEEDLLEAAAGMDTYLVSEDLDANHMLATWQRVQKRLGR